MALRYVPPAEFETAYHERQAAPVGGSHVTSSPENPTVQDDSERSIAMLTPVSDS